MKQFARCTHCQQWFVRTFTTAVETYHETGLQQVTLWCLRCVEAAEARSQPLQAAPEEAPAWRLEAAFGATVPPASDESPEDVRQLLQAHIELMNRAIHEEEDVLVPRVREFMAQCRALHEQLDAPDQTRRLLGHVQYWEAFLKALQQST